MALTVAEFDEWIAALESGEYGKAVAVMHKPDIDGYCCLGVLSHLHKKVSDDEWQAGVGDPVTGISCTPHSRVDGGVLDRLDVDYRSTLGRINDESDTFEPVIEYLREHEDEIVGGVNE